MRDHSGLVVDNFRGDFNRGEDETAPQGYFLSSQNVKFIKNGVTTRFGTSIDFLKSAVYRESIYSKAGEAKRLLILDHLGNLYDSTDISTVILHIAGMTDFSMVTIFGRAYITPHNGVTGLAGEKVYVYDGTTMRAAAGAGPAASPTTMTVSDAGSGNVELGLRAYAIAFETASGYITQIGAFTTYNSPGDVNLTVFNLPIGPVGTVARVLVSTKEIIDFNGDFTHQTYYFIPGGRIPNNTATFVNDISYFDADLKDNANFLIEQFAEIPAGVGLALIRGRLAVWGENANPDTIRFSTVGEPESISEVDGFIVVNPGDMGGGLKNACEYRGQGILFKSQRCYSVLPTPEPPAFWEIPIEIDSSVGTECHGLARALDGGFVIDDLLFVVDRTGFRIYNGLFSDDAILTFNIDDTWGRINEPYFHTVEIAIDPIQCLIYIAVPLDAATSPSHVLVGDYAEGLNLESIKWTTWTFPVVAPPTTVVVQVVGAVPTFKYGSRGGNGFAYDPTTRMDNGVTIDNWVEFSYLPSEADDIHNHYTGARFKVKGDGTLLITGTYPSKDVNGNDVDIAFTGQPIILSAQGRTKFSGFNVTSELCSIKARVNASGKWFTMTKYTLYIAPEWGDVD
jgi:hypothetical protein